MIVNFPGPEKSNQPPQHHVLFTKLTDGMRFWCWHAAFSALQTYGSVQLWKYSTFILSIDGWLSQQCCRVFRWSSANVNGHQCTPVPFSVLWETHKHMVNEVITLRPSERCAVILMGHFRRTSSPKRSNFAECLPFVNYCPDYGPIDDQVWKNLV